MSKIYLLMPFGHAAEQTKCQPNRPASEGDESSARSEPGWRAGGEPAAEAVSGDARDAQVEQEAEER